MNVTVSHVGGDPGTVRLRVESDLGHEVVSLHVKEAGPAREPNDDQDYDVELTLGGPSVVDLYAGRVTVGSWSASQQEPPA